MTFADVGALGTLPGRRDELVTHLTRRSDALAAIGCLDVVGSPLRDGAERGARARAER